MFAERTGHFALRLYCMEQFIRIFQATGCFAYAKCTRMYIQQMASRERICSVDRRWLFTVRRNDFLVAILVI